MHLTAMTNCRNFFDTYSSAFQDTDIRVVEIGSQDVNGSMRDCCPTHYSYVGADFVHGKGVDVVLDDPYSLPFDTSSVDFVLTSSCFEHSEMFWVLYLEALRIIKPHGLLYLNAPSNGPFHRFPVDCWRFYPDSGQALVTWAKRNGMNPALLESYTSEQVGSRFNDFVAVFVKDEREAFRHVNRILTGREDLFNGILLGSEGFCNEREATEDGRKILYINSILNNEVPTPNDVAKIDLIKKIVNDEIKVR